MLRENHFLLYEISMYKCTCRRCTQWRFMIAVYRIWPISASIRPKYSIIHISAIDYNCCGCMRVV